MLVDHVRKYAKTVYHPAGTCRMGTDAQAVVDPKLAVHGVTGLWIADASIMPIVVSGNTNAPAIMIGERLCGFRTRPHSMNCPGKTKRLGLTWDTRMTMMKKVLIKRIYARRIAASLERGKRNRTRQKEKDDDRGIRNWPKISVRLDFDRLRCGSAFDGRLHDGVFREPVLARGGT